MGSLASQGIWELETPAASLAACTPATFDRARVLLSYLALYDAAFPFSGYCATSSPTCYPFYYPLRSLILCITNFMTSNPTTLTTLYRAASNC